ncbi:hypothetical protein I4U23_031580 [Adineta vaga]|nr:hypothetical protein I4U23_031580 [Adineta vaga]
MFEESIEILSKALTVLEEKSPPDNPKLASCLFSIGTTLSKQDKDDEALIYYKRTLVIREKHYVLGDIPDRHNP